MRPMSYHDLSNRTPRDDQRTAGVRTAKRITEREAAVIDWDEAEKWIDVGGRRIRASVLHDAAALLTRWFAGERDAVTVTAWDHEWDRRMAALLRAECEAMLAAHDPAAEARQLELVELEALWRCPPSFDGRSWT